MADIATTRITTKGLALGGVALAAAGYGVYRAWQWWTITPIQAPGLGKASGRPSSDAVAKKCNYPKKEADAAKAWKIIEPEARYFLTGFAASRYERAIIPRFPHWADWKGGVYWRWVFEQAMILGFAKAKMARECFYSAELQADSALRRRLTLLADDSLSIIGDLP